MLPDDLAITEGYNVRIGVSHVNDQHALWRSFRLAEESSIRNQRGGYVTIQLRIPTMRVWKLTRTAKVRRKLPFLEDHLVIRLCDVWQVEIRLRDQERFFSRIDIQDWRREEAIPDDLLRIPIDQHALSKSSANDTSGRLLTD